MIDQILASAERFKRAKGPCMSAQAHTPGPWRESWDYKRFSQDSEIVIAFGCGPQITGTGVALSDSKFLQPNKEMSERMFADARLIAAAPDMLDALILIAEIAEKNVEQDDKLRANGARTLYRIAEACRAAIAKATKGTTTNG